MLEGLVLLEERVGKLHIEVEKKVQRLGERLYSWKVCHVDEGIEVVYKGVVHMVGNKVYRYFDSMEVYRVVLEGLVVEGCVWGISHILGLDIHIGEGLGKDLARCSMGKIPPPSNASPTP